MPENARTGSDSQRLDPFDPLFLSNSDHSTITLVSQVFDGKGFADWRKTTRVALMARNKWCFVSGSYKEPAANSLEHQRWEQVNSVVFTWIANSLSPEIRKSVIHYDSPKQVWDNLDLRFGNPNGVQLFGLEQELAKIAKGTDSFPSYFTRIKSIWDELSCADNCTTLDEMKKREENRRLFQLLMGLDESYTTVRGTILMMKPLPTIEEAYKILVQEENQREIKPAAVPFAETAASFHVDGRKMNQRSNSSEKYQSQAPTESSSQKGKTESKKPTYTCTNCKRTGHTVDRCYHIIGFPTVMGNPNNGNTSFKKRAANHVAEEGSQGEFQGISQAQYHHLVSLLNQTKISGKMEQSTESANLAGPFAVIDEHFSTILLNSFDAIRIMIMIQIIHQHQLTMSRRRIPCLDSYLDKVNISLWPRFKLVFDMHLNSLRNANVKILWEDDVHPHYVMRRYAEFTASLIHLNVEYGDGQLELNLERLRIAVDDLLNKLARQFQKPKLQTVFLINNYDMTISVLKEVGPDGGKILMHFEELLKTNTSIYVEELLLEHFSDLIKFVKTRAPDDHGGNEKAITVAEVEPLVRDFDRRWKSAIELMHKDVITSFSNFLCGMEILRTVLTQLLLYYTRFTEIVKKVEGGSLLNRDLVSVQLIIHEIKKFSRTF